jgi:hypothetical protein
MAIDASLMWTLLEAEGLERAVEPCIPSVWSLLKTVEHLEQPEHLVPLSRDGESGAQDTYTSSQSTPFKNADLRPCGARPSQCEPQAHRLQPRNAGESIIVVYPQLLDIALVDE